MSTAERSGQNMVHQMVNFLGKPVMVHGKCCRQNDNFQQLAKTNGSET